MIESIRYDNDLQHLELVRRSNESLGSTTTTTTAAAAITSTNISGNVLCTHDGVLLKKASAEYIAELNTSGSLSLVEFSSPKILCIEWRPNENILIADDRAEDQGDWALVDTIARRVRTTSECIAFDTKSTSTDYGNNSGATGAAADKNNKGSNDLNGSNNSNGASSKTRIMRTNLEELSKIEIKHRGQTMRFMRKSDGSVHSEFFFQHGNADLFLRSLRHLHIIDCGPVNRHCEEYIILNTEKQKLKKTFAELDIGEIKASRLDGESWLPNKVVGFLANIPDYVSAKQARARPQTFEKSTISMDNWMMDSITSQSRGSSLDKSPQDSELENVKEHDEKIVKTLPERQEVSRGTALNQTQWLEFQTPDGRISDPLRIREIIFRGGITHSLRSEVWKYLLNYYKWDDSEVERIQRRKERSREYYSMKAQWLAMTITQEENFAGYRERKCQIEKDVKRTDRSQQFFAGEDNPNLMVLQGILMTYVMYNFDLGYVQGMSDLLAPILEIEENEVDAFWCFVGFMDMVFANFDIDQAGMKTQFQQLRKLIEFANPRLFNYMITHDSDNMYFCFRWLLVWYKREFSNDDILKLWECLWTRLPCPNFHIFISLAILDHETDTIIENQYEFTEILKHVNELAGNIDVKQTLQTAEAIYLQVKAAENLTNDIRQIIGEPLQETSEGASTGSTGADDEHDFDESFADIVRELTPEEKRRQQEEFEEACERSMFLQHL